MGLSALPAIDRLVLATVTTVPEWHPEHDRFEPFPVHAWLIHHPDGTILVDTGIGFGNEFIDEWYRPERVAIADALAGSATAPSDIAAVVISHLHFDHCGQHTSVSAPVHVQAAEVEAATSPGYTVPDWADIPPGRLRLVHGDEEIADGVTLLATPGHTPGHQSVVVEASDGRVVLAPSARSAHTSCTAASRRSRTAMTTPGRTLRATPCTGFDRSDLPSPTSATIPRSWRFRPRTGDRMTSNRVACRSATVLLVALALASCSSTSHETGGAVGNVHYGATTSSLEPSTTTFSLPSLEAVVPTTLPPPSVVAVAGSLRGTIEIPSIALEDGKDENLAAPPLTVRMPTRPCASRDLKVEEFTQEGGPLTGAGHSESIFAVWSTVPCFVQGYPVLDYVGLEAELSDGGANVVERPPAKVAVLRFPVASFAVAGSDIGTGPTGECSTVPILKVGAPHSTPTARATVQLGYGWSGPPAWSTCDHPENISPFEQGITDEVYTY